MTALIKTRREEFVHLFQTFQGQEFASCFKVVQMSIKTGLNWIQGLPIAPYSELLHLISPTKTARCMKDLKQCMILGSANDVLQELCTERICHVIQASLAVHLYEKKYGQIADIFLTCFSDVSVSITNLNEGG